MSALPAVGLACTTQRRAPFLDPAMLRMRIRTVTRTTRALLLAASAACGGDASSAATLSGAAAGAPGGARRAGSINLAASDVGLVQLGPIEEAIRVSGDLRPIETVSVRSRIEGDVATVNVREGQKAATEIKL